MRIFAGIAALLLSAAGQELTFTDITESAGTGGPVAAGLTGGHGAAFADVDGDSRPDLYITMIFEEKMPELFYRNLDGKRFSEEGTRRGIDDFDGGSHGAVFADLDNDGDYDLFNGATWDSDDHPSTNDLYRNDGKGMFTDVSASSGLPRLRRWPTRGVAAFDADRDGDLDLFAVTNYQGSADPPGETNEFYRNNGGLQFTTLDTGALLEAPCGQGVIDTDYDGDGDVDIFCANRTGEVNILRNDGGVFQRLAPASIGIEHQASDGISAGDVDNDEQLDLLLAGDNKGYLYTNRGNGKFDLSQEFVMTDGYMGGFADLDNDGDLDLVFAGDSKIYVNDGSGNFLPDSLVPVDGINDPRGIAFADIDADGDMDFAVAAKRSRNWLVRNNCDTGNWIKTKLVSPQGQAGAFGAKVRVYTAGEERKLITWREARGLNGYLGQDDPVLHFGLGEHFMVRIEVQFLTGETATLDKVFAKQSVTLDASRELASGAVQAEEDEPAEPERE